MKKYIATLMSVFVVGSANAQIGILWDSQTFFALPGFVGSTEINEYVQPGALHVLIWSTTAPPAEDWANPNGDGSGAGEWVLFSGTAAAVGGDFDYRSSPLIFNDADVGGNDINSGYVYSRIFEGPTPTPESWYYQSLVNPEPTLIAYDAMNAPSTTLDHRAASGTPFPGPALGDTSDPIYGAGMFQVIPEPSVFAMLGLGGLFLALRRRYVA